jgi:hypothetical protein
MRPTGIHSRHLVGRWRLPATLVTSISTAPRSLRRVARPLIDPVAGDQSPRSPGRRSWDGQAVARGPRCSRRPPPARLPGPGPRRRCHRARRRLLPPRLRFTTARVWLSMRLPVDVTSGERRGCHSLRKHGLPQAVFFRPSVVPSCSGTAGGSSPRARRRGGDRSLRTSKNRGGCTDPVNRPKCSSPAPRMWHRLVQTG